LTFTTVGANFLSSAKRRRFTMKDYQSLSHTRWDCKYHVVFIPKWRKKQIFAIRPDEAGHGVSRHRRLTVLWAPLRRSQFQATGFAGGI
jgi:hypothetical protein